MELDYRRMKKLFLIILTSLICICSSCRDDDCWIFNIEEIRSYIGMDVQGYPKITNTTIEKCGLTEEEADKVVRDLTKVTKHTDNGITFRIQTTATKKRK